MNLARLFYANYLKNIKQSPILTESEYNLFVPTSIPQFWLLTGYIYIHSGGKVRGSQTF